MSIRRSPGTNSHRPSPQFAANEPRRLTEEESSEEDDDSEEENEEEDRYSELQPKESGIPEAVKQTLFLDIQARGGIDNFSLKKLCDDKPDIYGTAKSVFRRKIQNKVDRWKTTEREEYNKLRIRSAFGASVLQQQQQQPRQQPSASKPSRPSPSQPSRPSPSQPSHSSPSRPLPPRSRPFRELRFSPSSINASNMANPNPNPFIAALLARQDLVPIDVDLQRPENHGPFMVAAFTDRILSDVLYDGFDISLKEPRDMRWMFGAQVNFIGWYAGENQVILKIPSVSFGWLNEPGVEEKGRLLAGLTDPRVNQALTVARNTIQQNVERQFHYYLLRFPAGVTFDNAVFSPGTTNERIHSTVVPLYTQFDVPNPAAAGDDISIQTSMVNVVWQIATFEEETRYAGAARAQGQSEHEQQMNQLLAGIQRMNP